LTAGGAAGRGCNEGVELSGEQLYWLFFRLSGRISPGVYFLAGLMLFLIQLFFIYRVALAAPDSAEAEGWATALLALAMLCGWCNFAITAKRVHDFGKPTAFALIAFVVGFILVIALSFIRGDTGPNEYGARTNAPA
jgi:uncharacterized membrane protein YhaH (DUF805 family)